LNIEKREQASTRTIEAKQRMKEWNLKGTEEKQISKRILFRSTRKRKEKGAVML
jgi:hypothetical protein